MYDTTIQDNDPKRGFAYGFGNLKPAYRTKISVYLRTDGGDKLVCDYYNQDLNEIVKRLYNQAFTYGESYVVRSSWGYVESIR